MSTKWVVRRGTLTFGRERKLHAVECDNVETFEQVGSRASACGARPKSGWGCDLHAKDRCTRCVRALRRHGRG